MNRVSAYIIAYNEREKITDAINSVRWADEIVVADSHSADGTAELAGQLGARVVQIDFAGFGSLRNQAVAACTHEWIFSLDSDERATPQVRDEVLAIVNDENALDVYRVPRRNWFMGRWIRHSGWYPNYRQPQLFRRGAMRYREDQVHEGFVLETARPLGVLHNAIWQIPFRDLDEVIRKFNRYSTLSVARIHGRPSSMWRAVMHAGWAFFKHYVLKLGVLDGAPGFVIAFSYAEQTFYRYAKHRVAHAGWRLPTAEVVERTPPRQE